MILQSVDYVEYEGQPQEWRLEGLTLRPINLLVGRNASGKSRTLSLIKALAGLLAGELKPVFESGHYDVRFQDDAGKPVQYKLTYKDKKVIHECLILDGIPKLERGEGGEGTIFAEDLKKPMRFQSPQDELAAATRRDSVQHSFLEPLYQWAKGLLFYPFAGNLGQAAFAVFLKDQQVTLDPRDPTKVVGIYSLGQKEFQAKFTDPIKEDMAELGYALDEVDVRPPSGITVTGYLPGPLISLCVKEAGIASILHQGALSQGMFRALSLIIQLHYAKLALKPTCILVDDIGEGLDFERSCGLVRIVARLAQESSLQFLMSTNDRFVMNAVPLEDWSVLHRQGGTCKVYNYSNAREAFEEFKFTGLSNFDFFATDFLGGQPRE